MTAITYTLENDDYYTLISEFTTQTLAEADRTLPSVQPFIHFLECNRMERPRSQTQYQLELLMMGVYWQNYRKQAYALSRNTVDLCHGLLKARKTQQYKSFADDVRGILHTQSLQRTNEQAPKTLSLTGLKKLVLWIGASGDFAEESERLYNWHRYLSLQSAPAIAAYLRSAQQLGEWFVAAAKSKLGVFTRNVDSFRHLVKKTYVNREDIILCSRKESDYHLIMVGAEIMNRALAAQFNRTQHHVVLLPGCMRPTDGTCKGIGHEEDLRCVACRKDCSVGQIKRAEGVHADVRVVIHASDFASTLRKWKDRSDVGIIASACVLHLFAGGFEMQKLNIPSQCVLLNFSGCKRHWHAEGIPTTLNPEQLAEILSRVTEIRPTTSMPAAHAVLAAANG